jgi:geranylgeranyl diphosphate synthase type II
MERVNARELTSLPFAPELVTCDVSFISATRVVPPALALSYDRPEPARELAEAPLGMIAGQFLDVTGARVELAALHRLKTGRLFAAAVGLGLWAAAVPAVDQQPWRAFGEELGVLFQAMDDVIDGDGYAAELGVSAARDVAAAAARRSHERLEAIDADTSVLAGLVDGLAVRTA